MKKCPFCAEMIQDEAIYCRYCGHDLASAPNRVSSSVTSPPAPTSTSLTSRIVWAVLGYGCAIILTIIALVGTASLYGIEAAVCGFLVFPVLFAAYPFIAWYYSGVFPALYFAIWAFSLFAMYKANSGRD